jgi:uncharacterized membrane protein YphA (DoxX/SURF4 family)
MAQKNKALHVILWIAQALLASSLVWSGSIKLFQPIDQLALMWPWAAEVPSLLVKFTGVVDLLGAIGLVLPMLLNIKPGITVAAAIGIIVLMICATVFHISRGETDSIGVNVVFAGIAAFIAWGRARG